MKKEKKRVLRRDYLRGKTMSLQDKNKGLFGKRDGNTLIFDRQNFINICCILFIVMLSLLSISVMLMLGHSNTSSITTSYDITSIYQMCILVISLGLSIGLILHGYPFTVNVSVRNNTKYYNEVD